MSIQSRNNSVEGHPVVIGAALRGLHDMAQPLTVLQGSLELALMQLQTPEEYRQWLEFALEQAGRLASDLEYVQQVVRLQQPAEDVEAFTISVLMRTVLQQLHSILTDRSIEVTVIRRGEGDEVCASLSRVKEAVQLVFSSLCSLLPGGGQIMLEIEDPPHEILLQFRVADMHGQPISLESSALIPAGLKLAQAIVASTAGEMRLNAEPLSARVSLPVGKTRIHRGKVRKGDSTHV